MTARIIDGKAGAATLRERVRIEVEKFRTLAGRAPGLAVVLVARIPPATSMSAPRAKRRARRG